MESLPLFLLSAVVISLSGVLAPGPLTAAVVEGGSRSRLAGLHVSLGHGVVEMPLMALIFFGAGSVFELGPVRAAVGGVGGLYLLYLGRGMLRGGGAVEGAPSGAAGARARSGVLSGAVLSAGNPYFLLWWATVGSGLVLGAARFGLSGLLLFAAVHWLCDLAWYSLLAAASRKGTEAFGTGLYRAVSLLCGGAMLFFGGYFIYGAARIVTGTG